MDINLLISDMQRYASCGMKSIDVVQKQSGHKCTQMNYETWRIYLPGGEGKKKSERRLDNDNDNQPRQIIFTELFGAHDSRTSAFDYLNVFCSSLPTSTIILQGIEIQASLRIH